MNSIQSDQRAQTLLGSLITAAAQFPRIAFASSLGAEDMVLTDMIARHALPIRIFTLDTGKLHDETLALLPQIKTHYGLTVERVSATADELAQLGARQADDAIFLSVDNRKACCATRKLAPLKRALTNVDAWITGQRREQSVTRAALPQQEFDAAHGIEKLNPLADWAREDVLEYLRRNSVPVNALHAQGFPSIGCAPCTRAIRPGEDERAGRWWWESPEHKECGLHNNPKRPKSIIPIEVTA
jgi:phosphoadenosine phosphosulfate reductase